MELLRNTRRLCANFTNSEKSRFTYCNNNTKSVEAEIYEAKFLTSKCKQRSYMLNTKSLLRLEHYQYNANENSKQNERKNVYLFSWDLHNIVEPLPWTVNLVRRHRDASTKNCPSTKFVWLRKYFAFTSTLRTVRHSIHYAMSLSFDISSTKKVGGSCICTQGENCQPRLKSA